LIEWRARRIADPVERLRYLRQAHRPRSATAPRVSRQSWRAAALGVALALMGARTTSDATAHLSPAARPPKADLRGEVWLVERNKAYEIYSNGLRIETRFSVSNQPRAWVAFDRRDPELRREISGSDPVGIVFHTTESHIAPFAQQHNQVLKRDGMQLLEFVRDKRAYHFVVDRFGRVYRIVAESDAAFHAGKSIWADAKRVYLNLNASFLGVSFEGATDQLPQTLTPAQIHAGRILTEMLRARYGITAENCVTHAQVSVNPDNMRIGYHTDWAGNFPFPEMGLEDNYAQPIPALFLFGYNYDPAFLESTGARLWKGLLVAEERLLEEARMEGRTVAEYKKVLQKRYRERLAEIEGKGDAL
jgi:hypothetical protein